MRDLQRLSASAALGFVERAGVFERRGLALARARIDGAALAAAMVKRPSHASPSWQARTLKQQRRRARLRRLT